MTPGNCRSPHSFLGKCFLFFCEDGVELRGEGRGGEVDAVVARAASSGGMWHTWQASERGCSHDVGEAGGYGWGTGAGK